VLDVSFPVLLYYYLMEEINLDHKHDLFTIFYILVIITSFDGTLKAILLLQNVTYCDSCCIEPKPKNQTKRDQ